MEETYKEFFKDLKVGSFQYECPDTSAGYDGNVAWLVASCNMRDSTLDSQTREYVLNVSGVLKKEKAGWRFQIPSLFRADQRRAPPRKTMVHRAGWKTSFDSGLSHGRSQGRPPSERRTKMTDHDDEQRDDPIPDTLDKEPAENRNDASFCVAWASGRRR